MRNIIVNTIATSAVLLTLCCPGSQARSQQYSGETPQAAGAPSVESIRERAAQIAKYRDLLNDKDQSVREAAFVEMVNSTDPALQETAYEVGFASSEISMRALALRSRITRLGDFSFDVEGVTGTDQYVKQFPATVTYHAVAADAARGILIIADRPIQSAAQAQGELSASGLDLIVNVRHAQPACWGTMRLDDSGVLRGTLTCIPPGVCCPIVTVKASSRVY